jgi:hypothetical protein
LRTEMIVAHSFPIRPSTSVENCVRESNLCRHGLWMTSVSRRESVASRTGRMCSVVPGVSAGSVYDQHVVSALIVTPP